MFRILLILSLSLALLPPPGICLCHLLGLHDEDREEFAPASTTPSALEQVPAHSQHRPDQEHCPECPAKAGAEPRGAGRPEPLPTTGLLSGNLVSLPVSAVPLPVALAPVRRSPPLLPLYLLLLHLRN